VWRQGYHVDRPLVIRPWLRLAPNECERLPPALPEWRLARISVADKVAVFVDQKWIGPAERLQRALKLSHLPSASC
jgi:hypothetical protein